MSFSTIVNARAASLSAYLWPLYRSIRLERIGCAATKSIPSSLGRMESLTVGALLSAVDLGLDHIGALGKFETNIEGLKEVSRFEFEISLLRSPNGLIG